MLTLQKKHEIPNAVNFYLFCIFDVLMFYLQNKQKLALAGFSLPSACWYPLGTAEDPKYVVMETHYDNPDKKTGKTIRYYVDLV